MVELLFLPPSARRIQTVSSQIERLQLSDCLKQPPSSVIMFRFFSPLQLSDDLGCGKAAPLKCNSEILYYSSFPLQKSHKDISHECTRIAFMTRIQCQRFSWPLYSRPSLTQLFRFMSLNFLHHYYIVTVKLSHVSCPCQNLRQVNQNIYIFFSSVLYEHQRTVY